MTFKLFNFILHLILCNVLMSYSFSGFSQESHRLDSLLQELEKPKKDTNRANSMGLVARMLYRSDVPRAKSYATEALALSEALSYTKGLAEISRIMGNIHQSKALDSALYYYLESLKYYEVLDDSLGCIDAYYNIANVYLQLSNFEAAKKNQVLCYELAKKVNNHAYLFRAKNGMGVYYIGLGLHHEENKDSLTAIASYQKGIPFLLEALQHADSIDSEYYKSQAYGNLAYVKTALGDFDTALTYALRMLKTYELHGYEAYYPISYTQIADIYLKMGNHQQAISYANSALEWINESDGLYGMKQAYETLYKAHKAIGDYEAAVGFGQRMFDISTRIFNKEREEQIARVQSEFDTKQMEKENELLKKEAEIAESSMKKQRVYVVLALSLLALIIVITTLVYRNLLDKKSFARKVQDLQDAKTRWFTNIAHELRTPLTLILGPVCKMINHQIPEDSMMDELKMVQKNSEQLVNRVNEILDVSRMEFQELTVNRQPEGLTVLVREIIDSFQSLARQKSIFLKFSYNACLMLNIDRSKISTILNNLISNALKFTSSGGTVSVDLDYDPDSLDFVNIKVRDTGIGIPEQDLPYIFDRFYQVSHSQQPQSGGSGVGLALAQELARLHGGLISVSSLENHGSVFELSLPKSLITKTDSYSSFQSYIIEHTNEPTLKPEQNMTSGKPSILLVEDHPDMRQYIGKLLGNHYHVVEATEGQQAMEIIKEYTPDLIISDVMMPVMGGLTFAKKLKEDPKYKLTPFIALTAHANDRDKLMAYRTGIDDYMVKPFNAEELMARIQNLLTNTLERKKATQELLVTTEKDKQMPLTYGEKLIEELEKMVREHLSEGCSINSLATHAAMSESSLNRFLKKITGLTPGQFIRDIRLQEAIFLLESQKYKTISEVVYAVGFEDASSFTRLFKKRFGKNPSTYLESISK
ncbi:response regulator [Fulvivirga sp. M361]|uniref:ATP-binding protein n=1 Tax=Fulvivirga sp. M361 TaxID=2594266 RepID=UPI00117AAC2D|nr:ATP-binding protein [Fulvivirga sp. M361]TRX49050.1 response regulator [Fulvivirga sp. M361]